MSKDKRKNDIRIVCLINQLGSNKRITLNHEGGIGSKSPIIKEMLRRGFLIMKKDSPVKPRDGINKKNFFWVHEGVTKPRLYGYLTDKAMAFYENNKRLLSKVDVRENEEKIFSGRFGYALGIDGTRIYKKSGSSQNRFRVRKTSIIGLI